MIKLARRAPGCVIQLIRRWKSIKIPKRNAWTHKRLFTTEQHSSGVRHRWARVFSISHRDARAYRQHDVVTTKITHVTSPSWGRAASLEKHHHHIVEFPRNDVLGFTRIYFIMNLLTPRDIDGFERNLKLMSSHMIEILPSHDRLYSLNIWTARMGKYDVAMEDECGVPRRRQEA